MDHALIPISIIQKFPALVVETFDIFKLRQLDLENLSFTSFGCKVIKIRQAAFVAKTHVLDAKLLLWLYDALQILILVQIWEIKSKEIENF